MGPSEIGFEVDGPAIGGLGLGEPALVLQRIAEVNTRVSIVGFELDGPAIRGLGLGRTALFRQRISEVEMGLREIGL